MTEHYKDYVDGRFVEAAASMLDVYNPATQELLARVPESSADTVEEAIAAARKA